MQTMPSSYVNTLLKEEVQNFILFQCKWHVTTAFWSVPRGRRPSKGWLDRAWQALPQPDNQSQQPATDGVDSMYPWHDVMKVAFHLCGLPLKDPWSWEKFKANPNWGTFCKIPGSKVCNCHSQEEAKATWQVDDNVVSWIGFWSRERTSGEN